MKLNKDQQEVIDYEGHSLVVACPGSGKTRVIVLKIGHILAKNKNSRVCAVTFTRDAANELRERLVKDIGGDIVQKRTRIGTFHSLAIRQLRHGNHIGKVAAPAEQFIFVQRAVAMLEEPMALDDAVAIIEKVKSSRHVVPEADHPLYIAYADLLKKAGVDDLYDVLKKSLQMMQKGILKPYPVHYMLVDEFQDTDEIQLLWVLEHAKAGTVVTVVGDDDQSVYSFRNALGFKGMEQFRTATNAKLIALATNYRCRSEILSAAKTLIQNNEERVNKELFAARGAGGSVSAIRTGDRKDEATLLVKALRPHLIPLKGVSGFDFTTRPGDWAVLARNRRILDVVETELCAEKIRYIRSASESIWNRPPFVYFISIMKSIQTGDADGITHLFHWIGISNEHIDVLHEEVQGKFHRLLDGYKPQLKTIPNEPRKLIQKFAELGTGWRCNIIKGNYIITIEGLAAYFLDFIRDDESKQLFKDVCKSVSKMRGTLVQRANALASPAGPSGNDQKGLSEEEIALLGNGVNLMTMHGSKGLEWNNVWIVASETGVVPSPKNPHYDEERRLFYVAMTRARDNLHMSARVTEPISPFVTDAGQTAIFVTASPKDHLE